MGSYSFNYQVPGVLRPFLLIYHCAKMPYFPICLCMPSSPASLPSNSPSKLLLNVYHVPGMEFLAETRQMWFLPVSSLQVNGREAWKKEDNLRGYVISLELHPQKGKHGACENISKRLNYIEESGKPPCRSSSSVETRRVAGS